MLIRYELNKFFFFIAYTFFSLLGGLSSGSFYSPWVITAFRTAKVKRIVCRYLILPSFDSGWARRLLSDTFLFNFVNIFPWLYFEHVLFAANNVYFLMSLSQLKEDARVRQVCSLVFFFSFSENKFYMCVTPLRSQLRIIVFSMSGHGVQNRKSKMDCLSLSHPAFFQPWLGETFAVQHSCLLDEAWLPNGFFFLFFFFSFLLPCSCYWMCRLQNLTVAF